MSWSEDWQCYLPWLATVPQEHCDLRHTELVNNFWERGDEMLGVLIATNGVKTYRMICPDCRKTSSVKAKIIFGRFGLTETNLRWRQINTRCGEAGVKTRYEELTDTGEWAEVVYQHTPRLLPPIEIPLPETSPPEDEFWAFCQTLDDGLFHKMERQVRIGGFHVDFAFSEYLLAIEIDGFAFHSTQEHILRDRARQRAIQREGWCVYRFAALEVMHQPARCAREIISMIRILQHSTEMVEDWS